MNKDRKVRKEFLLCLFLGWLGVHRFYRKQPLIGILYMFTLGIAGIGWFIDTVVLLVELVKTSSNLPITQPILNHEAAEFHSAVKQDHTPEQRGNQRPAAEKIESKMSNNIEILENEVPVTALSLTNLKKYDHVGIIKVGHRLQIEEDYNDIGDQFYLFSSGEFKLGEAETKSMELIEAAGIDDVKDAIYIVSKIDQHEYNCKVAVFDKNNIVNNE